MPFRKTFDAAALTEHQRHVLAKAPVMAGMAVYSVSNPWPWGALRELRAASLANPMIKNPCDMNDASSVLGFLSAEARGSEVGHELADELDVEDEELPDVALSELREAGDIARGVLPEHEFELYVNWTRDAARCVAEVAPDRGEKVKISTAEQDMLAQIESALRGLPA